MSAERTLAERDGLPMSLVVFPTRSADGRPLGLRASDVAGQLEGRLALILPGTDERGARVVGERVGAELDPDTPPTCEVHIAQAPRARRPAPRPTPPRPRPLGATPLVVVEPEGVSRLLGRELPRWKRALDVVGAALGLVLLAPVMALIAVLIKLTSTGPVIYRQQRTGRDLQRFTMFKFRTMPLRECNV